MSFLEKQVYRDQVADLILSNADGETLVIASPIRTLANGALAFEVAHPTQPRERYRVTVKIDPIDT